MRKLAAIGTTALLALTACASSSDDAETQSEDGASTTAVTTEESGVAPGVTDDAIKVGIAYVDTEALKGIVDINHGDYKGTYQAMIDDLNDRGGINDRMIEPVYVPINPIGTQPSEEACLKLTEDEDVFAILGFFNADAVLCPLEAHSTAVIGGNMSDERLDRAKAPWFTWEAGSDVQIDAIHKFDDEGLLDGKVAVYAIDNDDPFVKGTVVPLLEELDVNVVEVGVNDAPDDDVPAQEAKAALIAQKFEAADADTMLVVGQAGTSAPTALEKVPSFRPKSLFASSNEVLAWINDAAGNDLSVLEGAVTADAYGPKPDQYDLPAMQDCIGVLKEHGVDVPRPPAGKPPKGEPEPFVSAVSACNNLTLFEAIAKKAGKDLDYATFRAAGESLGDLVIPSAKDPYSYGPAPHADGDAPIYLYDFDVPTKTLVRQDS